MDIQLNSGSLQATISVPEDAFVHAVSAGGATVLADALESPLGLPVLNQCVVPGDRVAVVVDPDTPDLVPTINAVWEQLQGGPGGEIDATIVFPADTTGRGWVNVLEELPVHLRSQAAVHVHDPEDEQQCGYLASSAGGERIYLSHYLTDADFIITIGVIRCDSRLGYRGTMSAIYPVLSNSDAIRGQSLVDHAEVSPADQKRHRELLDEIGWLLGSQFVVQVIPDSAGSIARAYSGSADKVLKQGREDLAALWHVPADPKFEMAVVSCPEVIPQFSWKQFMSAVVAASDITDDDDRIVVVASLSEPQSAAFDILRRCSDPQEVRQSLAEIGGMDAHDVGLLIDILSRRRVFLLTDLVDDIVDELGIVKVSSESELQRLIDSSDSTGVLHSGGDVRVAVAATT